MKTVTDTDEQLVSMDWDVLQWRVDELQRAGWPVLLALELANNADVDLHNACELLGQGCSPEVALRILL